MNFFFTLSFEEVIKKKKAHSLDVFLNNLNEIFKLRIFLTLIMILLFLSVSCSGEEDHSKSSSEKTSQKSAPTEKKQKITFAMDATWPPMEYTDPQGQIVGFSVDYMRAAGRHGDFEPEFIDVDWKDIFSQLTEKKYDAICSSVSITEVRKKEFDFSVPYFKVRQMLIVRSDTDLKDLTEFGGRKVGAQVNTTGAEAVGKISGPILVEFGTVGLAFESLASGDIDGVVCDDPVAAQFALASKKYKGQLRIAAVLETSAVEYYGVVVNRGNEEILASINKGILALKESGEDKVLIKKWIGH